MQIRLKYKYLSDCLSFQQIGHSATEAPPMAVKVCFQTTPLKHLENSLLKGLCSLKFTP